MSDSNWRSYQFFFFEHALDFNRTMAQFLTVGATGGIARMQACPIFVAAIYWEIERKCGICWLMELAAIASCHMCSFVFAPPLFSYLHSSVCRTLISMPSLLLLTFHEFYSIYIIYVFYCNVFGCRSVFPHRMKINRNEEKTWKSMNKLYHSLLFVLLLLKLMPLLLSPRWFFFLEFAFIYFIFQYVIIHITITT